MLSCEELLSCDELLSWRELLFWDDIMSWDELLSCDARPVVAEAPLPLWVTVVVAVCVLSPAVRWTVFAGSSAKADALKVIKIAAAMVVRFMGYPSG